MIKTPTYSGPDRRGDRRQYRPEVLSEGIIRVPGHYERLNNPKPEAMRSKRVGEGYVTKFNDRRVGQKNRRKAGK